MLRSFHTFMNLLGVIGTLMEGTGLKSVLEVADGENAVVHIQGQSKVAPDFCFFGCQILSGKSCC